MFYSQLQEKIPGTDILWHSALYLPRWDIYAIPTFSQEEEIIKTARCLSSFCKDKDIDIKNVIFHSFLRPQVYNDIIGGSKMSGHITGHAVDFSVRGVPCDNIRAILVPELEARGLRCEKKPGSNWVHVDTKEPGPSGRYFKP